jgi:2-succinyl-5-enolpyruvyl-6-hydroxy-3-cyclohexene-1-carboxylate synthase
VHHDERAAGFVALGIGLATGCPAVVLTTSGTAAVELHPAVVEAHHARVPLLAVTADRPPELRDVGAPQTIDQHRLFGAAVRWFHDPGPPEASGSAAWRPLAVRAVHEALGAAGRPPGPVQLNLPFREPLIGAPGPLPAGRAGGRPWVGRSRPTAAPDAGDVDALAAITAGRRVLVVAGGAIDDPVAVLDAAATLGWPVVADPRSGCRAPATAGIAHADAALRVERVATALVPDVVLRLGDPPASKVLQQWLADLSAWQVGVDRWGAVFDPDQRLDARVVAGPGRLLGALARCTAPAPPTWAATWAAVDAGVASSLDAALRGFGAATEPGVARDVLRALPEGSTLVVSSSMPVRDLEWFAPPREGVRVLANRGANGIDGVVSSAVGVALGGGPTAVLVGDVAFLHDTNALLGSVTRPVSLAIVVVDNRGGGIFSFLPQAAALEPTRFEQLFGTPHDVDLLALAAAHGVPGVEVRDAAAVASALHAAVDGGGVRLVVVRSDRAENVRVHEALQAAVATALAGLALDG